MCWQICTQCNGVGTISINPEQFLLCPRCWGSGGHVWISLQEIKNRRYNLIQAENKGGLFHNPSR